MSFWTEVKCFQTALIVLFCVFDDHYKEIGLERNSQRGLLQISFICDYDVDI